MSSAVRTKPQEPYKAAEMFNFRYYFNNVKYINGKRWD